MTTLAHELKRMNLGPSDVERNAKLGVVLVLTGLLPYAGLLLHGIDGHWIGAGPADGIYLLLLWLCLLAAPALVLGVLALALAGITRLFWEARRRKVGSC